MSAERLARVGLTAALEPEAETQEDLRLLLAQLGPEHAWELLLSCGRVLGLPGGVAPARARAAAVRPAEVHDGWRRSGGRFVIPGDDEWPAGFDDLAERAPFGLWVRGAGDLAQLTGSCVAVVGARACTAYGEHVAAELGSGLGEAGWTVVSGAAYGIDAAAHRGGLAVGAPGVAVLAGGADVHYPRAHSGLLERLERDGVVASEQPPGAKPLRQRFLARNRLLAAMTPATVVVEAAARSGSLVTARHAAELFRQVLVVPGPVTSALSVGCHHLLREGVATCVTGTPDVLEAVGPLGARQGAVRPSAGEGDEPDPDLRRVLDVLPRRGGLSTERVAADAAVEVGVARAQLSLLEVQERVLLTDRGWRVAPARPPRR